MSDAVIDTLTGMYFTVDGDEDAYGTGRGYPPRRRREHFVRFDGNEVTLPLELATIGEMVEATGPGIQALAVLRHDRRTGQMDRLARRSSNPAFFRS